jgi:membrane protease YdiL (CAAX protease family)
LRFIPLGIIILLIAVLASPQTLFSFPHQRPGIWLIVMFFYPILSAFPQELIYRSFFFHRYKSIFKSNLAMILMSTVTFGFLHIIYDNLPAVILSLFGGYLFSKTFSESRSLLLVSFEHALYGAYIFTVGLGHYFYEGF